MTINQRFNEWRISNKLTYKDLEMTTNEARANIGNWCRGNGKFPFEFIIACSTHYENFDLFYIGWGIPAKEDQLSIIKQLNDPETKYLTNNKNFDFHDEIDLLRKRVRKIEKQLKIE